MKNDDDHWETLNVFPEWYFNNEWYDVVTPETTIDALLKALDEMIGEEPDQWKRQKLEFIYDNIRILEDMQKKQSKENKDGTDRRSPFSPLVSLSAMLYQDDYKMYYDYYGQGFYQFFYACRELGINTILDLFNTPESKFKEPFITETVEDQDKIHKRVLEIRADILKHYENATF